MKIIHTIVSLAAILMITGCATESPKQTRENDFAHAWVKHSADYEAITRQTYGTARRDLERFIADKSWSAQPGQENAENLPPAVILDVDETVINSVDFQLVFERPFTDRQLEMWDRQHKAKPIPGVVEFVTAAYEAGVTVFFMTNRPCEKYPDEEEACPQKQTVIDGIRELGIPVEPEFVMLALEQTDWKGEKLIRRQLIARDYRIIMLIGDDFSDFVPCARSSRYAPCAQAGTHASRAADVLKYEHFWGNGWYILPGPMHGSWTSFR